MSGNVNTSLANKETLKKTIDLGPDIDIICKKNSMVLNFTSQFLVPVPERTVD